MQAAQADRPYSPSDFLKTALAAIPDIEERLARACAKRPTIPDPGLERFIQELELQLEVAREMEADARASLIPALCDA